MELNKNISKRINRTLLYDRYVCDDWYVCAWCGNLFPTKQLILDGYNFFCYDCYKKYGGKLFDKR